MAAPGLGCSLSCSAGRGNFRAVWMGDGIGRLFIGRTFDFFAHHQHRHEVLVRELTGAVFDALPLALCVADVFGESLLLLKHLRLLRLQFCNLSGETHCLRGWASGSSRRGTYTSFCHNDRGGPKRRALGSVDNCAGVGAGGGHGAVGAGTAGEWGRELEAASASSGSSI